MKFFMVKYLIYPRLKLLEHDVKYSMRNFQKVQKSSQDQRLNSQSVLPKPDIVYMNPLLKRRLKSVI